MVESESARKGKKGDTGMNGIEIYTGYYANIRKYLQGGCALIGISIGTPKWLGDPSIITFLRKLAPAPYMLGIEDEAEYTRQFRERVLGRLDYGATITDIERVALMAGKRKAVLLCYEKPPKFCHRSLVAEWISSHGEYAVTEYGYADGAPAAEAAKPKEVQPDLFAEAGVEIRVQEQDWR